TGRQPVLPVAERDARGVPRHEGKARVEALVGGGVEGDLPRGAEWLTPAGDALLDHFAVRNVVAATGGRGLETPEAALRRAGALLAEVERAVTAADFEALAVSTPGVAIARALSAVGFHPAHCDREVPGAITVFVV